MQKKRKKELEHFFYFYSSAVQKQKLSFFYPFLTQNLLIILNYLEKEAIIAGYYIQNMQKVKIFLRYQISKNIPLIKKIIFFSYRGRKRFLPVKMFKSFMQYYPNSFTLVATKYGILNLKQCQELNCGGELILSII